MTQKTILNLAVTLLFGAFVSSSLVSCGGDDGGSSTNNPNGSNTEQPQNENPVSDGESMSSEQQKQKLQAVANQFISYAKASDFADVRDLANELNLLYKEADSHDLGNWWKATLDDITTFINGNSGSDGWGGMIYYNYYSRLYSAAKIKGHFTVSNGKWIRTDANDLQISVKDRSGRDCVATLTTSGSTKTIFVGESSDRDYQYVDGASKYTYSYYKNYAEVPQNINFLLTVGGQQIVNVTVTTDINAVSEQLDLATDSYSVTVNATVKNYNVNVSRLIYKAQGQAALTMTLKKDNVQLLSVTADGTSSVSGNPDRGYEVKGGNVSSMNVDVLGQVQVKGSLDVSAVMKEKTDNLNDEATANRVANNLTAHLKNLGVYYDNGGQRRAWVEAAPTYRSKSYYSTWTVQPVVCFDDGTKYSFEEYFEESSWRTVIEAAKQVAKDFQNLINGLNFKK